MQHIDKLAIGLALLILLGGFASAALMKDQGGVFSDAINQATDRIRETEAEQSVGNLSPPEVENEVRKAFSFSGETVIPEWVFYRRPARLELFRSAVILPPELAPGWLAKVEVIRDASSKSTIHRISGRHSIFDRADVVSCNLEMSEGGSEWSKIATISSVQSGADFVAESVTLETGKSYSYRITTRARSTSSIAFASGAEVTTSGASGAVLYPANSIWRVSGAQIGKLDAAGNFVPGRVTVQNTLWNWDSAAMKRNTKIITESSQGTVGEDLFGTGFHLERIQDTADGRTVVLKDSGGKRMYLKNNADPQALNPDDWVNTDADPAEASDPEETDGNVTEVGDAEETPTKPTPSKRAPARTGGGLFGGGDDR
ncbi:MAG: hypothetical protein OSB09_02935 [Planctomycetota bacterium]|nr:hypothetical protein [Planctomycetota bacterium]